MKYVDRQIPFDFPGFIGTHASEGHTDEIVLAHEPPVQHIEGFDFCNRAEQALAALVAREAVKDADFLLEKEATPIRQE